MNSGSVTQSKGYTAAWAAPEILQGGDKATREGDIFAFGMVVIEVGQLVDFVAHLMSKFCFRPSQEDSHSATSNRSRSFSRLQAVGGLLVRRGHKDWV